MSDNGAAVGKVAAELMEVLDASTVDEGGTFTVGEVLVVAEVQLDWPDGTGAVMVATRCSDDRKWIQMGLLAEAERTILTAASPSPEDPEEEE